MSTWTITGADANIITGSTVISNSNQLRSKTGTLLTLLYIDAGTAIEEDWTMLGFFLKLPTDL